MSLQIEIDRAQIEAVKKALSGIQNAPQRVFSRAVNKTMTGVRTDATREIGNVLNLKAGYIRDTFTIEKTTTKQMTGAVRSKGTPVGLINFTGTREVKAGVSVKVRKDQNRTVLKHAFIESVKSTPNVWWRTYSGPRTRVRPVGMAYAKLPRKYRFPIERKTGPRIQDIYDDPQVMNTVLDKADVRLKTNINAELNYELSKLK